MKPQNFEEKVIWYCIVGTYVLYFLGAQFIVIPVMAWILGLYVCKKLWEQTDDTPVDKRLTIPFAIWIWAASMLAMEVALIMGHLDFDLGTVKIIKSTINSFARTWALFVLFPLIGSLLNIRPQILCRAICLLCLQTLIIVPFSYLIAHTNLAGFTYISPLQKIGGLSDLFYTVKLFDHVRGSQIRLRLFAPWSPALGLVANVYFYLACLEPQKKWRWIGIAAAIIMIIGSVSRAAIICLPATLVLTWLLVNFTKPRVQIATGTTSFFLGFLGTQLLDVVNNFKNYFHSFRSASSATRDVLNSMSLYRWQQAPIWGHGMVESAASAILRVPLGTHHTWIGLLFRHGIVGFSALAFPMLWSFLELIARAQKNILARVSLSILITLFVFSFVENLDPLTYLFWPGLVMMGMALKVKASVN
ncbi:O-antigen ligase family protein [Gloeocapsopsis crepidinum LEGE 06123]|uniref:O-antigen ligase family protein n=1 Tax=Gloeocapsopsis crepidinum LEGE 06123 TaxID=588587 RepID=A0ABR9UW00_9CHRO|nr:O-antigen ligase family protein [Gloeocapsopsis crepidinum]MBE9192483.1 O-antigen ligase family protein [Gloeocapsopsis crepidinum LEGE 06123]